MAAVAGCLGSLYKAASPTEPLLLPSWYLVLFELAPTLVQIASIARAAGRRVLQMSVGDVKKYRKDDQSIVTEADLEADRMIRESLTDCFPEDSVLTEETGVSVASGSERVWVVDPLDGTRAFAKGIAGYCVMIGLLEDGIPTLGVVYDPRDRITWGGSRGQGCFLWPDDESPQELLPTEVPAIPRLITTPSLKTDILEELLSRLNMTAAPSMHSVGLKVAEVLRGTSHVYYSHHPLSYWDTVAPVAMALEYGATCTMIDGSDLSYDRLMRGPWAHPAPLVVSRGVDHNRVIDTLRALRASL